ncbi:SphA family protein [Methylobacterium tarhaniae]|uniref:SphA family protein n=1 Tax=Methylobacterium tarhaniae TaxID=1187852 RepID=UPI003D084620
MSRAWRGLLTTLLCVAGLQTASDVQAAEAAQGVYLLGFRGPLAGVTPPPGFYFENDAFFYQGDLKGGRVFQSGGVVASQVKLDTYLGIANPIWVTPAELFGGSLGFQVLIPYGTPAVNAGAVLFSPRIDRVIAGRESDAVFNVGDIYASSFVGWHSGNFHWNVTLTGVIPSGSYQTGQLSNISLNRPALDLSGALTYLDPVLGYELSVVPGFTFNWINPATQYLTGTEFHLEWSVSKYLTKELTVGLVGYFYDQLTGDSGRGDRVGPFKGRVTALGGSIGYTFKLGEIPVSTSVRVLRELDTRNRFEGTATWLTIAAPLWVAPPKPAPEPKTVVAKF